MTSVCQVSAVTRTPRSPSTVRAAGDGVLAAWLDAARRPHPQARRAARHLPSPRAVSTLAVDNRHFTGSWVIDEPAWLADDPFRLLDRPTRPQVEGGLFGPCPPLLVAPRRRARAGALRGCPVAGQVVHVALASG